MREREGRKKEKKYGKGMGIAVQRRMAVQNVVTQ
jgi:hypothetical protein